MTEFSEQYASLSSSEQKKARKDLRKELTRLLREQGYCKEQAKASARKMADRSIAEQTNA